MSVDRTRTFEEAPWISLLPNDQSAARERAEGDPEAEEWAALVAADRTLEDDFSRPSRSSRLLVPLAAAGLLGASLLVLNTSGAAERGPIGGASSATGAGEVAAVTEVPERNRVVLASSGTLGAATGAGEPGAGGGGQSGPQKPPAGGGGTQAPPPGSTPPPDGQVSVPGIQVPSIQVPPVSVPPVQVPGVQLPLVQVPAVSLPPVQVPQLPQLPALLPPRGQ